MSWGYLEGNNQDRTRGVHLDMDETLPSELYTRLSETGFFGESEKPRELILKVLRESEKREERQLIIFQAPPGYGKTAVPYSIGLSTMLGYSDVFRTIHVLPLRSIIEDVWMRLQSYLMKLGLQKSTLESIIGAQMMYVHGSPFLQKKLVFTTIDTFFMSAAKLPPAEVSRIAKGRYGYYEVPRASMMQSAVVFDEVHLFMDEGGKIDRASSALIMLLRLLVKSGVPVIIMSATMPSRLREELTRKMKIMPNVKVKEVLYFKDGRDPEFEAIKAESKITTCTVKTSSSDESLENIGKLVKSNAASYSRVMVVLNTVARAVKLYNVVRSDAFLIHSRFTARDRSRKLEELRKKDRWILVATQVVEAGVDISAHVLISDAAPANSLIQRVGRICRKGEEEGEIVIVFSSEESDKGYGVYNPSLIKKTFSYLEENKDRIFWHLPHPPKCDPHLKGYEDMIEHVYAEHKFKLRQNGDLWDLLTIPFLDSRSALELYFEYGSFTRDSSLLPLVVLPEGIRDKDFLDFKTAVRLIYANGVPTTPSLIYALAKRGELAVLERHNGTNYIVEVIDEKHKYVKALFSDGRPVPQRWLAKRLLLGEILGYATFPQNYTYEVGLMIGDEN